MSSHDRNIRRVSDIISVTNKRPTIVNDKSKFVIVTYWWGRGNYNNNTARPCVRVGYLKKERQRGGGGNDKKLNTMMNDHEAALTQFAHYNGGM